jgi:RNA polymerase sigma-70 factor (sigma-E family)
VSYLLSDAGNSDAGSADAGSSDAGSSDAGSADGAREVAQPHDAISHVSALFRERHAELVRLATLVVGDRPTAEDVVQDVFARLCHRSSLPAWDQGLAYARAAVLNGCRSTLRRRKVALRIFGRPEFTQNEDARDSAEDEVILAEDRRQVLAALAALPVRRREVLVLRYWLGLSGTEIASVLGISTGTVKSSASRGIAELARKLGEQS